MKRRIRIVCAVTVSVLLIGTFIYQFFPLYGNTVGSIKKIIARQYDLVSIVDVVDVQDYRLVGFVSAQGELGYSVFHKNKFHNYDWKYTGVQGAPSGICSYYETLPEEADKDGGINAVTVTISVNPNLAAVKRVINDKYIDEKEISACPAMAVLDVDIPENQIQATYFYYDKNGNQIDVK